MQWRFPIGIIAPNKSETRSTKFEINPNIKCSNVQNEKNGKVFLFYQE
jgi:hypothetical protein